jgi:cohesin complex subunit SCC1
LLDLKYQAFRPGVVDLTEEQLTVNKNAITLPTNGVVLDLLMPDVDWCVSVPCYSQDTDLCVMYRDMDFDDRPMQRQGHHHQAHVDDITLRTVDVFQLAGVDDAFEIGPSDGIGSQDYNDVDLGIDWDGEPRNEPNDRSDMMSVDGSVGVGRDAYIGRDSLEPGHIFGNGYGVEFDAFSQREKSREASEAPSGMDMNLDIPDLGVDLAEFGIGFDDVHPAEESVLDLDAIPALSRACKLL